MATWWDLYEKQVLSNVVVWRPVGGPYGSEMEAIAKAVAMGLEQEGYKVVPVEIND